MGHPLAMALLVMAADVLFVETVADGWPSSMPEMEQLVNFGIFSFSVPVVLLHLRLSTRLCARRRLLIDSHLISHQTFRADIALASRQPPFVLISSSLELCPGT